MVGCELGQWLQAGIFLRDAGEVGGGDGQIEIAAQRAFVEAAEIRRAFDANRLLQASFQVNPQRFVALRQHARAMHRHDAENEAGRGLRHLGKTDEQRASGKQQAKRVHVSRRAI